MRYKPSLLVLAFALVSGSAITWQGCITDSQLYPCGFDAFGNEIICCENWNVSCLDPDFYSRFPRCEYCLTLPDGGQEADAAEDADGGPPAGDAGLDADLDAPDGDPPDAAKFCPGECIAAAPVGWSAPVYVAVQPAAAPVPACPGEAPVSSPLLHAGLVSPPAACGACSCDPPTGTCALPTTFTASATACSGGVGTTWSFDPPVAWAEGVCTNSNAVPAASCSPGPCVKSLTAGPLAVADEPCGAVTAAPDLPSPPPSWETSVLACTSAAAFACADPAEACSPIPRAGVPEGFKICVSRDGDWACPAPFPDKIGVAAAFEDQRGCSPCTCGPAAGSFCDAHLHVYADDACATEVLGDVPIGSTGAPCFDLIATPGTGLGSKSVDKVKYHPGACGAGGGEPTGAAVPAGSATFCCLP